MGGGGMMRAAAAAAKVAGIMGGFRGIKAENYSVSSAARRTASLRPAAAATTTEDVKLVESKPQAGVEIDDWAFAMPRVVFGGVPTLQEAKEATSELTEALEKVYLSSPNSIGHEDPFAAADHESISPLSKSQVVETKACVTSETAVAPAVPCPAIMAFKFLRENPEAQNAVASIACDPDVWNAVLKNQELQGFLQSQSSSSSARSDSESSAKSFDTSSDYAESKPAGGFKDIFQKIRITVVDKMSSGSGYFQNFLKSFDTSSDYAESKPVGGFKDIFQKIRITVVDKMSSGSGGGQGVRRASVTLWRSKIANLSRDTVWRSWEYGYNGDSAEASLNENLSKLNQGWFLMRLLLNSMMELQS
ncbi:hypothetical protein BUALT_Bualt18G0059600 [Buddleja alternifolia]|uniref:Uncharacterized protein n=1 Tax=Buddleja alternifolia TaxID=168488 RepID=A0AAV6W213_9LAMI|nr:hypothetical protein BUALT_Bualt18G0059600 [Buddleja alternifolia]